MSQEFNTTFCFEGNLEFANKQPVLSFVFPMSELKELLRGDENRSLEITHVEIVHLLARIFTNASSSESDRSAVELLLNTVLESQNSSAEERKFVESILLSARTEHATS